MDNLENKPRKNTSVWIYVLIIIVCLAIGVVCGWFVKKHFTGQCANNGNNQVETPKCDNEENQNTVINTTDFSRLLSSKAFNYLMLNDAGLGTILNLYKDTGISDFSSLSNDEKLFVAGIEENVDVWKFKNILNDIFNSDLQMKFENYHFYYTPETDYQLLYDEETSTYKLNPEISGRGYTLATLNLFKVDSISEGDNTARLVVYGVGMESEVGPVGLRNNKGEPFGESNADFDLSNYERIQKLYETKKDEFYKIEFTFTKAQGTYFLKSYKLL